MDQAREQFFRYGLSSVTMDQIARSLGMSKKTVYRHFDSKQSLVRSILRKTFLEIQQGIDALLDRQDLDFLNKLKELFGFITSQLTRIGPSFLRDVQRLNPTVWAEFIQWRRGAIEEKFGRLIRQGIRQGCIRDGVEPDFLMLIYLSAVEHVLNPEMLSVLPMSAPQAFERLIRIFFWGILREEARSTLEWTDRAE